MFVEDKIKRNKRLVIWGIITLLVIEIFIFLLGVLINTKPVYRYGEAISLELINIVWRDGWTYIMVFLAFVFAWIVRGFEIRGMGVELEMMDEREIDAIEMMLEKQRRKIQSLEGKVIRGNK